MTTQSIKSEHGTTIIDSPALRKIRSLKAVLKELDEMAGSLEREFLDEDNPEALGLPVDANRQDAADHLRQVHYLLTSAKGHLGAVNYVARGEK